jgi:hypothetical protein
LKRVEKSFYQWTSNNKSRPTKRAPDAGDSAAISGSFLRLVIFLVGRLRRPRPSAGNACRWALARQLRNKWRKKSNHIWRKLHEKVFIFDINSFIV